MLSSIWQTRIKPQARKPAIPKSMKQINDRTPPPASPRGSNRAAGPNAVPGKAGSKNISETAVSEISPKRQGFIPQEQKTGTKRVSPRPRQRGRQSRHQGVNHRKKRDPWASDGHPRLRRAGIRSTPPRVIRPPRSGCLPNLATNCRRRADAVGCIRYILGHLMVDIPAHWRAPERTPPEEKRARLPRRVFPCALAKMAKATVNRGGRLRAFCPRHLMNTPVRAHDGHQKIASWEKRPLMVDVSSRAPNGGRRAAIRGAIPLKARASGGHPRNIGEHQMDASREKKPDLPMLGVFLRFGQNGQNDRQQRRASRAKRPGQLMDTPLAQNGIRGGLPGKRGIKGTIGNR